VSSTRRVVGIAAGGMAGLGATKLLSALDQELGPAHKDERAKYGFTVRDHGKGVVAGAAVGLLVSGRRR
jgi:hypothetical protein